MSGKPVHIPQFGEPFLNRQARGVYYCDIFGGAGIKIKRVAFGGGGMNSASSAVGGDENVRAQIGDLDNLPGVLETDAESGQRLAESGAEGAVGAGFGAGHGLGIVVFINAKAQRRGDISTQRRKGAEERREDL